MTSMNSGDRVTLWSACVLLIGQYADGLIQLGILGIGVVMFVLSATSAAIIDRE